jgi:hypothetical protein
MGLFRSVVVCFCAVVIVFLPAACSNPCEDLAERICSCELTAVERQACRADRITSRNVEVSANDEEVCAVALDTCTCAALDQNQLDACAFAP